MSVDSLSRNAVREVDRIAIEEYHLPGIVLMENAGRNTAELLCTRGIDGPVVICCGKGNNGGDGFVIARHLENRGHEVRMLLFASPQQLQGDALTNYRVLDAAGTSIRVFDDTIDDEELSRELRRAGWIVDALLGTGTHGEIREPFTTVIDAVNETGKPVLAVDLPSGLDCDSGEPLNRCIEAALTATFVARKTGFDNPVSRQYTGEVHVVDIGVPRAVILAAVQSQNQ